MDAPNWFVTYVMLSAAAASCGDMEAAAAARLRLLALLPNFEAEAAYARRLWRFEPKMEEALLRGLRQAGFKLKPAG